MDSHGSPRIPTDPHGSPRMMSRNGIKESKRWIPTGANRALRSHLLLSVHSGGRASVTGRHAFRQSATMLPFNTTHPNAVEVSNFIVINIWKLPRIVELCVNAVPKIAAFAPTPSTGQDTGTRSSVNTYRVSGDCSVSVCARSHALAQQKKKR